MSLPAGITLGTSVTRDQALDADVCVIGSGAGGAVVARELAERGLDVLVLEEGGYFDKDDYGKFNPSETFRHLYRDAAATVAIGTPGTPSIPIQIGRAVGGSTVVNGGVCFRTPQDVLEDWQEGGLVWSDDEIQAAFTRVEETLGVIRMPEAVLGGNSNAFRRGCQALGLQVGVMQRNTPGCDGCCRCIFGCPGDKKKALHVSYLPRAIGLGARVQADCRAEEILVENGRATGVRAAVLDRASGRPTGVTVRVRARAVVLAAGAIHTPAFLARTGLAGNSGVLGKNLALHPGCRVLAEFEEPIDGHRGAFQGLFSTAFDHLGIKLNGIFLPPGFLASTFPYVGARARRALLRYRHIGAFGVMLSDESAGRVRHSPLGPLVTYTLDTRDKDLIVRGIIEASKIWFAAGAKRVYPGLRQLPHVDRVEDLGKIVPSRIRATDLELVSQHPMGTARMSPDRRRGVLGPDLQHHDVRGLYIPDASWFPSSVRVNPQITIMGFATLAGYEIARALGK